jgi:hypothetical protein
MIHWYERVAAPLVLGGAVWMYGRFQQQGTGYQIFVKYLAVWMIGIAAIIFTHDLLEQLLDGLSIISGFVWTAVVGFMVRKRHLT